MVVNTIILGLAVIIVSGAVKNLLHICGFTKTEIDGGPGVSVVYIATSILNLSAMIFLAIVVVSNFDVIMDLGSCFSGGR